jgi:hypothetical protein
MHGIGEALMGEIGGKGEQKGEGGSPPEKPPSGGYEAFAHGEDHGGEGTKVPAEVPGTPKEASKGYVDKPLREFRENYPGEYIEPGTTTKKVEPFGDPQEIANKVNPKFKEGPEYQKNCCDVSRAVEDSWRGREETAAGRVSKDGEDLDRMEEWRGESMHKVAKMDDVRDKLSEAGPGSSAIVMTEFDYPNGRRGGKHAFNIVNKESDIKVIDGQHAGVYDYKDGPGHPLMGTTRGTYATGWNGKGERLWQD